MASAARFFSIPQLRRRSSAKAGSETESQQGCINDCKLTPQVDSVSAPSPPLEQSGDGEPLEDTKGFDDLATSILAAAEMTPSQRRSSAASDGIDDDYGNPFAEDVRAGDVSFESEEAVASTVEEVAQSSGNECLLADKEGLMASPSSTTTAVVLSSSVMRKGGCVGSDAADGGGSGDREEDATPTDSVTNAGFFRRRSWFAGRGRSGSQSSQNSETEASSPGGALARIRRSFMFTGGGDWKLSMARQVHQTYSGSTPGRRYTEYQKSLAGANLPLSRRFTTFARDATQNLITSPRLTDAASSLDSSPKYPAEDKYTANQTMWTALENDYTVLIKGSWLRRRASSSNIQPLPRRQDLVEQFPSAVWKAAELKELMTSGSVVVIAVSHCWLTKEHPDPKASQLRVLGHALGQMLDASCIDDLAVFYDWCSLYQRPRCDFEEAMYRFSREHVPIWFAHTGTRVWMLTQQNEMAVDLEDEDDDQAEVSLPVPYAGRGWTNFERSLADMATRSRFLIDIGKMTSEELLASDWEVINSACRSSRRPPVTPEAFRWFSISKEFSEGEIDREFVSQKYAAVFFDLVVAARELSYHDLDWTDLDVEQLAAVLPLCLRLRTLVLHGNSISAVGGAALLNVLPRCPSLKEIWLTGNPVCKDKEGKDCLRAAWALAGRCTDGLHL
eukprot:TRINITY_DN8321_c0_g1_i1.p1 TRINITY_DN8321_c0_g1~~TRINITY_DN8321_c0_g1_i1.p1  ORF type:complete len:708 (+),score=90.36 TRINITY_DN8321_c0_g1_i1:104-2125(+)